MNPQMKDELLRQRAEVLAMPMKALQTDLEHIEVLVFKLANEEFAIETKYIKEVYPLSEFTPLPGAPSFVMGLVNLRRKIIVVIDLKVFFSLLSGTGDKKKIIVLQDPAKEFGIAADGINGIQKIPLNTIQSSLPTLTGLRSEYLRGVTVDRTVILDGSKLLLSKQLVVDETVEV